MAYLKSLERLKSLPEKDQQLASGYYVYYKSPYHKDPECGCIAGKLLPTLYDDLIQWNLDATLPWVYTSGFINKVLGKSSTKVMEDVINDMAELELTIPELVILQDLNDRFRSAGNSEDDRRERYNKFVWFLEKAAAENLRVGEAALAFGW